jgi:hypothetical protein
MFSGGLIPRLRGFRAPAGFLSAPQLHLPGIASGATGVPFILNLMNYQGSRMRYQRLSAMRV